MVRAALILSLIAVLASCGKDDTPRASGSTSVAKTTSVLSTRQAKQLFGAVPESSNQSPAAFGGYAKGCMAGGVQLPETGPTWQAMRLSRNRNWALPITVDFVQDLSRIAAREPGWQGLYVGDMSQPRGGPMLTGHRSHQSGLDADIWMRPPDRLNLTATEREKHFIDFPASRQWGLHERQLVKIAPQYPESSSTRPTRCAHLCLSRCKSRHVQFRNRRSQLFAENPSLVGSPLSLPCATEMSARDERMRGSRSAAPG